MLGLPGIPFYCQSQTWSDSDDQYASIIMLISNFVLMFKVSYCLCLLNLHFFKQLAEQFLYLQLYRLHVAYKKPSFCSNDKKLLLCVFIVSLDLYTQVMNVMHIQHLCSSMSISELLFHQWK